MARQAPALVLYSETASHCNTITLLYKSGLYFFDQALFFLFSPQLSMTLAFANSNGKTIFTTSIREIVTFDRSDEWNERRERAETAAELVAFFMLQNASCKECSRE